MPWGVAAAAAVSVIGGVMSNKSAKKAQQAAAYQAMLEQQARDRSAEGIESAGKEVSAWSKDLAAKNQAISERSVSQIQGLSDAAVTRVQQADDIYNEKYAAVDRRVADDAMGYDSPERIEAEAARASATVGKSFDEAQGREGLRLARYGLRPEDTVGGDPAELAQASAQATAANESRRATELTGIQLRQQAAQAGRNIQGQAIAGGQAAASLATGASNVANAAGVSNLNLRNAELPYLGLAAQVRHGSSAQTDTANRNAGLTQAGGQALSGQVSDAAYNVAGAYLGSQTGGSAGGSPTGAGQARTYDVVPSDPKGKKGRKPVSGKAALSAVKKTPVESWQYKKGVGDGGKHIGPMADKVQKNMGEQAGPGGKMIDLVSMNGVTLAAVQEVAKKVERIEGKLGLSSKRRSA